MEKIMIEYLTEDFFTEEIVNGFVTKGIVDKLYQAENDWLNNITNPDDISNEMVISCFKEISDRMTEDDLYNLALLLFYRTVINGVYVNGPQMEFEQLLAALLIISYQGITFFYTDTKRISLWEDYCKAS